MKNQPSWQLPRGVSSGTWDYSETTHIATSYDSYFSQHGMFRLDESVVAKFTQAGDSVIDLGCGTGRAIKPLLERDIDCVACDLSQSMLEEVQKKAMNLGKSTLCVRANLVELDCFADNSFDCAMCLFSTLGMIRGNDARSDVVQHVSRMLKPGGLFILQVHNYWVHLFDPEGPWWMIRNAARTCFRKDVQLGDRFYLYRGIPDMYLHSFSWRSLQSLLREGGFEIVETTPLNAQQDAPLRFPGLAPRLRASGWIVVARASA